MMARHIPPFGEGGSGRRPQRFGVDGGCDPLSVFRLIVRLQRIVLQLYVNLRLDEPLCVEGFWAVYQVLRKRVLFARRIFQAPLQELLVKETPV
jgi:hypothetical protein